MKKITSLILLISNISLAGTCDWSSIKALPDGGYEYSPALNLCVGNLVQTDKVKDQQISDFTKAISLKDLAIQTSDARTALWQKSSDDEMDRLTKISSDQKRNDWLYFGLGVLTTIGAGFMAAKLIKP